MSLKLSPRLQTAKAFIDSYNAWDIEKIIEVRSEDCVAEILPGSLQRPKMTNDVYRVFFGAVMPLIHNFTVSVHSTIEDAAANKIVMHASSTGDTSEGRGTYSNEYILILEFTEDGSRVRRIQEFVDSARSKEQAAILSKAKEAVMELNR